MLYFKNEQGRVYAYGSLEEREQFGAPDLVALTPEEEASHLAPPLESNVPDVVSRFQARAALLQAGLLSVAETAIASGDPIQQLAWADAQEFRRASPTVAAIGAALGLSEGDIDDLFIAAAAIEA